MIMALQASTIMIGVKDVDRAKKFYAEGMGCAIKMDHPGFATLSVGRADLAGALRVGRRRTGRRGLARGDRVPWRLLPLPRRFA